MPTDILDIPLLQLTPVDPVCWRDLFANVCVLGQTGSGKTTGSGAHLAKAILKSGAGVLVLSAKADERALWERYCAATGRNGSLIVFDGKTHRYNFIAAELARHGLAGINTVIELLMEVMEAARGGNARPTDPFWVDSQRVVLRHALPVIYMARGTVTIADIVGFVRSAPRSPEEMTDPAWQARSFFYTCFRDAAERLGDQAGAQMASFWRDEWATLDAKTKGNIAISLTTTLDRFNHGWLREAFTTDSTVTPELLMQGAVMVLDMPAVTHLEDGVIAQRLMLKVAQRVLLARQSYGAGQTERPVVIWMDEAQHFVSEGDAQFLSTSRSIRACTVMLSQSLASFFAVMNGENARDRVEQLLGNCATRIWHSSSCPVTTKNAADMLGQVLHRRANFSEGSGASSNTGFNMGMGENWGTNQSASTSYSTTASRHGGSTTTSYSTGLGASEGGSGNRGRSSGSGTSSNVSDGWAEQMGYLMEPAEFGRLLKTGGPSNGNRVSAVWYQAGRRFAGSGGPSLLVEFAQ